MNDFTKVFSDNIIWFSYELIFQHSVQDWIISVYSCLQTIFILDIDMQNKINSAVWHAVRVCINCFSLDHYIKMPNFSVIKILWAFHTQNQPPQHKCSFVLKYPFVKPSEWIISLHLVLLDIAVYIWKASTLWKGPKFTLPVPCMGKIYI